MTRMQAGEIDASIDTEIREPTSARDKDPTTRGPGNPNRRPPGRPRKLAAPELPKRPRGRPRKVPLPAGQLAAPTKAKAPPAVPAGPPLKLCDDNTAAAALGLSVHWLRKDRRKSRIIPFVQIGTAVRYDLEKVRAALQKMERGGYSFK
jgi:hypothetical protein